MKSCCIKNCRYTNIMKEKLGLTGFADDNDVIMELLRKLFEVTVAYAVHTISNTIFASYSS